MILIIGLGNPGEKYELTRHNVGFMALDRLAKEFGGKFEFNKKFNADFVKLTTEGEEVILAKPQTFMNCSGDAVQAFSRFYDINFSDIWVIHDDLDIEIGKIRIRKGGSSAGQKGVQSVIDRLGTDSFVRFRVGIQSEHEIKIPAEDFVLRKFRKEEQEIIDEEIEKIVELIKKSLKTEIEEITI